MLRCRVGRADDGEGDVGDDPHARARAHAAERAAAHAGERHVHEVCARFLSGVFIEQGEDGALEALVDAATLEVATRSREKRSREMGEGGSEGGQTSEGGETSEGGQTRDMSAYPANAHGGMVGGVGGDRMGEGAGEGAGDGAGEEGAEGGEEKGDVRAHTSPTMKKQTKTQSSPTSTAHCSLCGGGGGLVRCAAARCGALVHPHCASAGGWYMGSAGERGLGPTP